MTAAWMISSAYSIVNLLPAELDQARKVLAIVHEIVEKVGARQTRRGRPGLAATRSGARFKAKAKGGVTKSKRPR